MELWLKVDVSNLENVLSNIIVTNVQGDFCIGMKMFMACDVPLRVFQCDNDA